MKKAIIITSLVIILNSCSSREFNTGSIQGDFWVSLVDEDGNDLLNEKTPNNLDLSKIQFYVIDDNDKEHLTEKDILNRETSVYYKGSFFQGPYLHSETAFYNIKCPTSLLFYKVVDKTTFCYSKYVWDEYNYDLIMVERGIPFMEIVNKLTIEKHVVGSDEFETEVIIGNNRKYTRVIKRPKADK